MRNVRRQPKFARERLVQGLALGSLLLMGAAALVGPSGILAWGENQRVLAEREKELAQLKAQRDELQNRVSLLDPRHADPDLTGELLRSNLNVVHPDEMVMLLK
ncbi:MAG TPA: septum formation initiator family protein [Novosphingobium sp.]